MVEVQVARLGIDSTTSSYVVILREKTGRRLLPIWIGKPEAESILMQMNQISRERPLTHDLCKALIIALGGAVRRVTISRVVNNTYFAELHLDTEGGRIQLDARPSDSIAIALRVDAPIFVEPTLLSTQDDEDVDPDSPFVIPPPEEMNSDQLKAYLEQLRPEDFGKFRP